MTDAEPAYVWGIVWLLAIVIPIARIFYRAGFSWAWGLLCIFPILGWIAAWVLLAMRAWPWRRA